MKIAIIFPDLHIPFEDKRAVDLVFKVVEHIQKNIKPIDSVTLLGDAIDLYGLSRYDKDPAFGDIAELYDREMACANMFLDRVDEEFSKAREKIFIEGNHEYRMKKYMNANAGALRNVVTVPSELGLASRAKWKWVGYNRHQSQAILGSSLFTRHEPFGASQPKLQAQKAGGSFLYGHTHEVGEGTYVCKLTGRVFIAINAGCLVKIDEKVFDYCVNRPNWSHAFVISYFYKDTFTCQVVRILPDYTCFFDGRRFKS